MKFILDLPDVLASRLIAVAEKRGIAAEVLALAYIEDWLSIDYPEMLGRCTRRSIYRDGPIAFDPVAADAAARTESDVRKIESRRAGNNPD